MTYFRLPFTVTLSGHTCFLWAALLGVSVVCAETDEEADALARTHDLLWVRIRKGETGRVPTHEEARSYPYTPAERQLITASREMLVWGSPARVRERLVELAQ